MKDFAFGFNLNSLACGFKEDFLVKLPLEEISEDGDDGTVVDGVEFMGETGISRLTDDVVLVDGRSD